MQTFLTGVGDTPTHQSLPVTTRQEVLVQILSLCQNKREERVMPAAAVTTHACAMMHTCT